MTNRNRKNPILGVVAITLSAVLFAGPTFAAGDHGGGHGHKAAFGEPGDAKKATRTINVVMHDNYYEPEEFQIKAGETILFKVKNAGALVHEFNIGTESMHEAHQKEMMKMFQHGMITPTSIDHAKMKMDHGGGSMKHDDPNAVLLNPGESAEFAWKFTAAEDLQFACNIPGHYAAGMMGEITF